MSKLENGSYVTTVAGRAYVARPDTIAALDNWQATATEQGGFIHAILCNDLIKAMHRADGNNLRNLPAIIRYCYMHLDPECWGSVEKVANWKAK
jgi:hypothetical protein